MIITLAPSTESLLREKAERDEQDLDAVVGTLLPTALEWETQDRAEAIAGGRRGDQAAAEGRERPLSAFLVEQRVKTAFSSA